MIVIFFKFQDLGSFNLLLIFYFDFFRLEDVFGCSYDLVEIFDGFRIVSFFMGKFCVLVVVMFFFFLDIMIVVFRSDFMIINIGFYVLFNAILQGERELGRKFLVGFWFLKDRIVFNLRNFFISRGLGFSFKIFLCLVL